MIDFEWLWAFLLLPLPALVYFLAPKAQEPQAIQLPSVPDTPLGNTPNRSGQRILLLLMWLGLVTATARPVWLGDPVEYFPEHRDMMLVVDLSYSMSQEDMQKDGDYIDRLSAVKQVVGDFVTKRKGDRLGLVLFADHAYLQTPLTLDRQAVKSQLDRTVLKLIGTKTAIGDGIGLATKTFIDSDAPQRVMVLLSDGSNTAGLIDPIEAASIAKEYNATIYTVGVGAGEMVVKDFLFERVVNTAEDLDEKTLIQIADMTGGQYFRARDSQELATIYDTINALEPVSSASQTWRPRAEWFWLPLIFSLFISLVLATLRRNHG
ncbi:vWA domain-containing protein [Vibrio nigripulchritudo]|uniref:vWA domain-containing protein n=1 Tax=Vibrio nigripulchritudo TaxID=28173 RepID=UPI0005FA24AA|nr:VWA domain-containing protein [Vibrio nigripulchritudo]KJY75079.1 IMP dehydrogenase [Vibrio nigripulchritudo]